MVLISTTGWILVVVAAAVLIWLFSPARRSYPNPLPTPEALSGAFRLLLDRGIERATVTVAIRDAPERAIVFEKYIRSDHTVGFRSTVRSVQPDATKQLKTELDRRGIRYADESVGDEGEAVLEFDYGTDIGLAQVVTRLIFRHLFSASVERDGVALFKNIMIFDYPRLTGQRRPSG
jgi:hypothetical protein